jgi:outer membrane protein assembly factor BamB
MGAPVSDGERVFVAAGRAVVALDARTGTRLWRAATARAVRNAPVVVAGLVVFVEENGVVHALDAALGTERWHADLGAGLDPREVTALAPPVAAGGVVYAGGPRHFAALDAATGVERWHVDAVPDATWRFTLAGPAASPERVVATVDRSRGGLIAWSRDGEEQWRVPASLMYSTDAAPVIAGDTIYVASGTGDLLAIDADDGEVRWSRLLTDDHHSFGYAVRGTPALAGDTVVVATEHDVIWALDAATGDGRWTFAVGDAPVYPSHYRTRSGGFAASPVITGDIVWAAATDGTLVGLDLATGAPRQRLQLGAPVFAGLAAAGDLLIVAGWDGTVHAFATGPPEPPRPAPRAPVIEIAVALVIAISATLRLRRRRAPATR